MPETDNFVGFCNYICNFVTNEMSLLSQKNLHILKITKFPFPMRKFQKVCISEKDAAGKSCSVHILKCAEFFFNEKLIFKPESPCGNENQFFSFFSLDRRTKNEFID